MISVCIRWPADRVPSLPSSASRSLPPVPLFPIELLGVCGAVVCDVWECAGIVDSRGIPGTSLLVNSPDEHAYWKSVKADDKKYKHLMANYRAAKLASRGAAANTKGKNPNQVFNFARYKEVVIASTSALRDDKQTMMWEDCMLAMPIALFLLMF